MFGVQYGGECHTALTAENTYDIYGPSTGCSTAGTGGVWCQEVYKIGQAFCFGTIMPVSKFDIMSTIII